MARKKDAVTKVDLALQGGGAHGAFTWGVLDRLLEEGRIEIEGISGTSAGAKNAVARLPDAVTNARNTCPDSRLTRGVNQ